MLLNQLPPEILALVLSSQRSFLVIQLWKCGSKALNHLLSNGGCTEVDLKDENQWSLSRWPKMLRSLRHLRKLRIRRSSGGLMPIEELPKELMLLAPSLESLELKSGSAETCLFNFAGPMDEDGEYDLAVTSYPRGQSRLWDVGAVFPRLHTLSLESRERDYGSTPRFRDDDLAALPSTLTYLKLRNCLLGNEAGDCPPRTLPPNLLTVRTIRAWGDDEDHDTLALPSSLTDMNIYNDTLCTPEAVAALPRGLVKLNSYINWVPGQLEKLPLQVSSLFFGQCPAIKQLPTLQPFWSSLPSHLTFIKLTFISSQILHVVDIASLPRTLETLLTSWSIDWREFEDGLSQSAWPPQLRSLKFYDAAYPPPTGQGALSYFQCWPRTLTWVDAGNYFATGPIDMRHLPQGLRELSMHLYRVDEEWLSVDSTGVLPPTLTKLKLSTDPILYPRFRYPDSLRWLDISALADAADDPDPDPILWPAALEQLWLQPALMSTISTLPPSLKLLNLVSLSGPKDSMDSEGEATIHDAEEFGWAIRSLSRLETLEIEDSCSVFDGSVISYLPKTLKTLHINLLDLSDALVSSLPRSLTDTMIDVADDSKVTTSPQVLELWPIASSISHHLAKKMGISSYAKDFPFDAHPDPRLRKLHN